MPTRHEAILQDLEAVLSAHPAEVTLEQDLPGECPVGGLLNIQPEDPVEAGFVLGAGVREWRRDVSLELIVRDSDPQARREKFDAALVAIADLVMGADLSGKISFLLLGAPEGAEEIPMADIAILRGAVVPVTLFYETSDNPMEIQT
jgi:hypothetical protein